MKKSVEVTLLLAVMAIVIALSQGAQLTGMQSIDVSQLPAPPSPPGMMEVTAPEPEPEPEEDAEEYEEYEPIVVPPPRPPALPTAPIVTPQVSAPAPSQLSDIIARIDGLQSKVDAQSVDLENLKQIARRPTVDQPAFMEGLAGAKRNTILSISLSLLVFSLLIGLVVLGIVNRKKDAERNRTLLKNYLRNYTKEGYRIQTLQMHLRACGWPDNQIRRAIDELKK